MSAKTWSWATGILLTVVLVVSLGIGVWLEQNGPQWPRAIEMMKILPAENVSLVSYLDFRGRLGAAFRDQWSKDYHSGELWGQDVATIQGLGSCVFASYDENATGESEGLVLYEGDFDRMSMARALEGDDVFGPASRRGGVLVWTRTQGQASISIALIDNFIVSGTSERVQQCVEAAQDKRKSLYDNVDARDVMNRLPKDLGFFLGVGSRVGEDEPGRLAAAFTFLPVATEFTSTTVEKFLDVDAATARVADLEAERTRRSDPTDSKISQDGVFVISTGVMNFD